jgi:hypothetical protein
MHVVDLIPNRVRNLSALRWWATLLALLAFLIGGPLALAKVTNGNQENGVSTPTTHSAAYVLRPGV